MAADLPPSIAFILDEFRGNTLDTRKIRKRFDDAGFWNDLADQCGSALGTFDYADFHEAPRPGKFQVFAAGGLSPLSSAAKCAHPRCRVAYVHHFARTAGLYADRVIVPDEFTWDVLGYSAESAVIQIAVLKTLKPLLDEGVVVFSRPAYGQCSACAQAAKEARRNLTNELWTEFAKSADVFPFRYGRQWRLSFGSPLFFSDGDETRVTIPVPRRLHSRLKPNETVSGREATQRVRDFRTVLRGRIKDYAANLVFEARMGSFCNATVATNAVMGAAGFRFLESRAFDGARNAEWAAMRRVRLPEFERLSVPQVLAVRELAHKALPAFRARIQQELFSLSDMSDEGEDIRARKVANELQIEARELQGKLASISLPATRRRERLLASMGVLLEIVALSTGRPELLVAAGGTFAALLLAAHTSQKDRQEKHEVFSHAPAYVLLTAERVHAMRH